MLFWAVLSKNLGVVWDMYIFTHAIQVVGYYSFLQLILEVPSI